MKSLNPLRQRFINVMYLILIAMMLLQVNVEFIETFTELDKTLERANYRLERRSLATLQTIKKIYDLDSTSYHFLYTRILRAREISDSAIKVLDSMKTELITKTGGYNEYGHLNRAIESHIPTKYFVYDGRGEKLRQLLDVTKKELLQIMDEKNQILLDTVLKTQDSIINSNGRVDNWVDYFFDNKPLAAVVTTLTKFQNDVRIAESIAINRFYEEAQKLFDVAFFAEDSIGVDTIIMEPGIKASQVFNLGDQGVTRITVPGIPEEATRKAIIYTLDEQGNKIDSFKFNNGVGEVTLRTDRVGEFKIKGVIRFREEDRQKKRAEEEKKDVDRLAERERETKKEVTEYPFEFNYKVVNPQPVITRGIINSLYTGLDNPIEVKHPSYPEDRYRVTMYPGKIIKGPDGYYARVTKPGYATVSLEVKNEMGKYIKVASQKFAVKTLPKPKVKLYGKTEGNPNVYGKSGGLISEKIFKLQKGLEADLSELDIEGKFRVVSFDVIYINGQGNGIFKESVKGSYFTGKARTLIDLAQPGDMYIFDNIYVKGPDGKNIRADGLVFTIE